MNHEDPCRRPLVAVHPACLRSGTEDLLTVDNGTVKIGIDRAKGASITWLSWTAYPKNIVNSADPGRLIQQSYYAGHSLNLTADSPEEVLGVLAHELSHVTEQHGMRGIVQGLGLYAIVSTFFGDVSGLAAILVNNAPFLLSQKFSRDHEREADEQGFRYLEAAKLNPRGMISFFEKMRREEEKLRDKLPGGEALDALSFLSTHPATTERTERLEKLLEKSPRKDGFTAVDLNFKEFQQALRSKLSQPEKPDAKKAK